MNIKEKLENELHNAIRNQDENRKRTIRMAISNIKLAEVEKRGVLSDDAVIALLYKEVKIRKETIEDAKKGERQSIIEENESEIKILQEFLPNPLSDQELKEIALGIIHKVRATSPKDMGVVMKEMIAKAGGRASSDIISSVVRELLQSK